MTEAPISPLRRRMIEDMTIRKFPPRTQEGYIRAVKDFSALRSACRNCEGNPAPVSPAAAAPAP